MSKLIYSLKIFLRTRAFRHILGLPEDQLAKRFNQFNGVLFGSPIKINWLADKNMFHVTEQLDDGRQLEIYNGRSSRIVLYFSGLKFRVVKLAKKYLIPEVQFAEGDVIFDCGANVGELGKYFEVNGDKVDYYAFEPAKAEADCAALNNPAGSVIHKGLWKESGSLTLFEANDTADSSLIECGKHDKTESIDVVSIDDFVSEQKIKTVKLLKLEAEGAEPEILAGAVKSLKKIHWVTADCGPERGADKEMTFKPVINSLMKNGFEVEALNPKKNVVLMRNTAFDK